MRPISARRPSSAAPRAATAALLALGGLACSDGPLGGPGLPGGGVSLRLESRIEPRASVAAAAISKVRLAVTRVPDGLVVLDSVVDLAGQAAELDLAVPLATAADRFAVHLAAADAAGDTIFRAADTTAVARGSVVRNLDLLLRYAGPDTGVTRIVAGPEITVAQPGESMPLWVVGYRPGAADPSPLAHVGWRSGDEAVVRVSRTSGQATAIAPGRSTWVYATTVTGLVDSARVVVRDVLATLEPSATSLALTIGETTTVAVTGRVTDGTSAAVAGIVWTSSDPTVAIVDERGTVAAVGAGTATITAESGALRATIPIVVRRAAVTSVSVTPGTVSLLRTARGQLAATVTLETGAVETDRAVAWTTSDAGVAAVDAEGIVRGVAVGNATITATVEGRSASATVAVAALPANGIIASPSTVQVIAGETFALGATVTDAAGDPLPDAVVTWTTANPGVATVSGAGQLTAIAPGATTVTAGGNGRASTIAVTVLPIPVDSVLLSRDEKLGLIIGTSADLDATPIAASGAPLRDRAVTWSSSAPSVATVDAAGRVVAVGPGKAYVTATSEGVGSTVKVDVLPIPVARVELPATSLSLTDGGTYQLRADAYDSLGRLLPGRPVVWSSSDPSTVGVAIDGLVTAKRAGVATVTAAVEGRAASATVVVAPPPVPTVLFTPAGAVYALGQTTSAQAVGISQDVGAATLQLASRNGAIASVQPTVSVAGVVPRAFTVTGLALGPVRLQATSSVAATGVSDVTIAPAMLRAVGWAGAVMPRDDYIRIRLEAAGALGTDTTAVFAEATPFTLRFDRDTIEVHRDEFPTLPVGAVPSGHKNGQLSPGDTIQATVGARYMTLIIKGRRGPGTLTISAPGRYVPLDLRGLTILP